VKVEVNQEIAEELVAATHSPDIERVKIHHPGLPLHVCRGDDDRHTHQLFHLASDLLSTRLAHPAEVRPAWARDAFINLESAHRIGFAPDRKEIHRQADHARLDGPDRRTGPGLETKLPVSLIERADDGQTTLAESRTDLTGWKGYTTRAN